MDENQARAFAAALADAFKTLREGPAGDGPPETPATTGNAGEGIDVSGDQGLEAVAAAQPVPPVIDGKKLDQTIEVLETWSTSSPIAQVATLGHGLNKLVGSILDIGKLVL